MFGYWHAISESLTIGLNLIGSSMLHYYSTRMINNIWILEDGRSVEVEFMDAFFVNKTKTFRILNFGSLEPSRLLNVDVATHEDSKVYINISRNLYSVTLNPEYQVVLEKVLRGQEFTFVSMSDSNDKKNGFSEEDYQKQIKIDKKIKKQRRKNY